MIGLRRNLAREGQALLAGGHGSWRRVGGMLDESMNQWLREKLGRVALPVHEPSGVVRAVVGLAWSDERDLGDAWVASIAGDAASLP